MSVAHQLNNAMLGKEVPHLITQIPRAGFLSVASYKPDTKNQMHGSIKGTDNPMRSLVDINGSVRGVMPCCGIEASGVWGTRVLRREPIDSANSMVVPQGAFKGEDKGLAYLPEKPLNAEPQRPRDFCHAELFSRARIPGFRRTD